MALAVRTQQTPGEGGQQGGIGAAFPPGSVADSRGREQRSGHIPASRQPWYVEKPISAQDIVMTTALTGVTVGPGPVSNVVICGPQQLPQACIGVIKSLVFEINNMVLASQISFGLWINNGPAVGFGLVNITPRQAPFYGQAEPELTILLPLASQFQIVASVADGGTYVLGANARGWFLTEENAAAYSLGTAK